MLTKPMKLPLYRYRKQNTRITPEGATDPERKGRSNDRQTGKGMPNTEEGVWLLCHTTEAAPDVSGHVPNAVSSVGEEAVIAPRNDFTKSQQLL